MLKLKKSVVSLSILAGLVAISGLLSTQKAHSDDFVIDLGGRGLRTEERVERLERVVQNLQMRLANMERGEMRPAPIMVPAVRSIVCDVRDRLHEQSHIGRGFTRIEAEAAARNECGRMVNSMFCDGAPRCE